MKPRYAVLWCSRDEVESGRLEPHADGFELSGRAGALSLRFADVTDAAIARGQDQRLRGLPVLALLLCGGASVRIASLEGAGVLHELVECVKRAGLTIPAA
jgi:hypothetical protein